MPSIHSKCAPTPPRFMYHLLRMLYIVTSLLAQCQKLACAIQKCLAERDYQQVRPPSPFASFAQHISHNELPPALLQHCLLVPSVALHIGYISFRAGAPARSRPTLPATPTLNPFPVPSCRLRLHSKCRVPTTVLNARLHPLGNPSYVDAAAAPATHRCYCGSHASFGKNPYFWKYFMYFRTTTIQSSTCPPHWARARQCAQRASEWPAGHKPCNCAMRSSTLSVAPAAAPPATSLAGCAERSNA